MTPGGLAILFFLCAAGAWLGGFLVYGILARLHIMDVPNARSSHDRLIVRGGGVAILLILLIGWTSGSVRDLPWLQCDNRILLAILLVAGISFADDIKSISQWIRLLFHGLAAGLALVGLGSESSLSIMAGIVGWCWILGYANAFNFMDGINGLAATQALLTCLFGAIFCLVSQEGTDASGFWIGSQVLLGGAALGFLPHNFPKARMFLGDVGSVTMGFLLALFVLGVWQSAGWKAGMALAVLHSNFFLDTAITMIRRLVRGERIHEAHREHFYQRLHRSGVSHAAVTLRETALQLAGGLALAASLRLPTGYFALVVAAILSGWLLFFGFCERKFRDSSSLEQSTLPAPGQ